MAPVSKSTATATWVRRPSRYLDDNPNLEESSSGEDTRPRRKSSTRESEPRDASRSRKPSLAASDVASSGNGRSYVDPWDMENYSFLRRQLEDVSISDNDVSSTPAFESTQSDFYYVPLDGDGSPQYQYKQYVDGNGYRDESGSSPLVFRDDTCGRVAGVDEHHFYNDYLDPHQQSLYGSYNVLTNPSRQSERSRYNNQDYQTYTPPSILKDLPLGRYNRYQTLGESTYGTNKKPRAKKSHSELHLNRDIYGTANLSDRWTDTLQSRRKSFSDVKIAPINRRQSFQDVALVKEKRRKSALDGPLEDRVRNVEKEKIIRRQSIHEIAIPDDPFEDRDRTIQRDKLSRRQSMHEIAAAEDAFEERQRNIQREKMNRRQSINEITSAEDIYEDRQRSIQRDKLGRRQSINEIAAAEDVFDENQRGVQRDKISRRQSMNEIASADDAFEEIRKRTIQRDKISRRQSMNEVVIPETHRSKPLRPTFRTRRDILEASQSAEELPRGRFEEIRRPRKDRLGPQSIPGGPPSADSSLVYVYETARRRRKMVLPNTEIYGNIKDFRFQESDSDETTPTVRSETYSMRPLGRYAMSNYGHLKIDYSCSWNNLYRYVTDKVRA